MTTNTDSMELFELKDDESNEEELDAVFRRRGTTVRAIAAGAAALMLLTILVVLPTLGFTYPHSRVVVTELVSLSEKVLQAFGITPVLISVAALTVVALIRKLHYGIGAVITLTIGASLTTAAVRTWAAGWVPASALPNGYVTACAALMCAATLVAATRHLPIVWGLGTVTVLAVGAAAVISGAATIIGVTTTLLIVAGWWAAASAVMLYSPVAAQREARNPLDTAAMAVQRRLR